MILVVLTLLASVTTAMASCVGTTGRCGCAPGWITSCAPGCCQCMLCRAAPNARGPYQPNAYGPGIDMDATGRPFVWQTQPGFGPRDPLSTVQPDAYGPGIGMDQYGRPVQAVPFDGRAGR
jgi:hypothetical protein